jgi:phage baseplate assembly protein V
MTSRRLFVPRAQTTDKRIFGVVEAVVVEVIDPDKEGRVKLQFPWFDEEMVTEYCRVRQLYAGNGYGACFVPEVGDEVLVAFIHGDMRMPVVLGGLYNGKDKPPTARAKDRDQKMIRTKAGHELIFDDHEKKVTLKSNSGHTLELDDNGQTVTLETAGGQSMVLDAAGGRVTVTGATIVLDGSSVQVGGTTASVKVGGASASMTPLLAEMFLPLFASHTHMLGYVPTTPPVPTPPITPQLSGSSTVKLTP